MLQAAQSTATEHGNAREKLSDSGEDDARDYLVQNAYQAVRLALEQGVGAPTTDVRDQDTRGATLPAFSGREQDSDNFSRIVNLPEPLPYRSPPASLHALQEWEGFVTEISDAEFSARLTDLTSGANYAREEADIPLDEISEDDAAKMQVGSIFRWVIGYERAAGSKKRVSNIVFRDLSAITRTDLRDGEEWAHKIIAAFEQ